ncbi:MAG TPA: aminotransferase class III-fold pyridoxal phosphate-dependent enzyme [Nannocystis sp.]|jgi:taurine--2-oxoglutarate transaminase
MSSGHSSNSSNSQMIRASELAAAQRSHLLATWSVQGAVETLTIDQARGARFHTIEHGWLWDLESQVYNVNIGHGNLHVQERMINQIREMPTAAPNAVLPIRAELGALLHRVTGLEKAFLATGGSEAVENAIKIARLVTGRSKVITRRSSYHGATLAVLGVAGDARKQPFVRDLAPAYHIEDPYPFAPGSPSEWVRSAERVIEDAGPDKVAAILLEGFTGTNGMQVPPGDFWPAIRALCDRHGILLIDDEIFSGFGRTGKWFAREHWGVKPDMMVLGKGLTSGYAPLSAVMVSAAIAAHFDDHKLWCGLTQYAHPVSCAAAVGVIEVMEREGLVDNSERIGAALHTRLTALARRPAVHGAIRDVRGLGLMRAVEFDRPVAQLHAILLAKGAYVPYRDQTLFLCPPLCLSGAEMHTVADLLEDAVRLFLK